MKVQVKEMLVALVIAMIAVNAPAQEKEHSLVVGIGGGLGTLLYSPNGGTTSMGFGGSVLLGYDYFFTSHWGVEAGVEIASLHSSTQLNGMESTPSYDDANELPYEFRTYYTDWREEQDVLLVEIPVSLRSRTSIADKWNVMVGLGAKLLIPVYGNYEVTRGKMETRGFYPDYNLELFDLPQHGFTTNDADYSGEIPLKKFGASVFADFGATYKLTQKMDLYVGAYVNYGFTNLIDGSENGVMSEKGYSGVLSSSQVDKVNMLTVGLKIGVSLPIRSNERTREAVVKQDTAARTDSVAVDTVADTTAK